MPRPPRSCYDTSFFHVIVQGINKEYIFKEKAYMKHYLELLNKYKENTNIEIISYCIMNNHAHILLYTKQTTELSKYMQKVNTMYAKYYNYMESERKGYVFRDRFLSEPIMNEKYLVRCINYIHFNPIKAGIVEHIEEYEYSSYKNYVNGDAITLLYELLETKFSIEIFTRSEENTLFKDIDNNMTQIIDSYINKLLENSNFTKEELIKDRIMLRLLIKYLKKACHIKYTDIMKRLNLTKCQVEKLKG